MATESLKILIDLDVKGNADVKSLTDKLKEIGVQAPKSSEGIRGLSDALRASASGAATFSGSLSKAAIDEASLAAKSDALKAKIDSLGKEMASGAKDADTAAKEFADFEKSIQINGLPKLQQDVKATGKEVTGMGAAFKGLLASGLLLAAGQQLLAFGKASIMAASDVEEMTSKFDTVFKDLGGEVTQELQTFAEAANRSVYDLKGFAATLQDTFVPLGFARDKAADMSIQLVKLAEDLASFNNLPTQQVVEDLQSALVGNTETLRKYGVVAQETQIKQEAMATGLWDGEGAISAQAKAQAILQLTLKGTTDAQGDAIKTADSFANQMKGLEGATMGLKVALGEQLLPAASGVVGVLTDLTNAVTGDMQSQLQLTAAYDAGIITYKEWLGLSRQSRKEGGLNTETNEEYAKAVDGLNSLLAKQAGELVKVSEATVAAAVASNEAASADAVLFTHIGNVTKAEEARTNAIINYSQAAAEAAGINENLADKTAQLAAHTGTEEQAALAANLANERYFATLEQEAEASKAAAAAQAELAKQTSAYFQEAIKSEGAIGLFNESAAEMADRTIYVSNLTGAQRDVLADLQSEYEKAQSTIDDYTMGVKGIGLTTEEVNDKVLEQQERMAELQTAIEPLTAAGGEYAAVQGTMSINEEALNSAIYDSAVAAGASAEQLAILGGALGLYSDEAVEAALQTAAIQIKIDELAQAYVDGTIGVEDMRQGIQDFIAELSGVPTTVVTDVQVTGIDEAIAKAGSLADQLNQLGNQISPADAAGAGQKEGGGIYAAGGADFVVPPGYPNDSFGPLWVQSGEHVKVTPQGQTTNNSNSVVINQAFNGTSPNAMQDARNGTMAALREAGITGFG